MHTIIFLYDRPLSDTVACGDLFCGINFWFFRCLVAHLHLDQVNMDTRIKKLGWKHYTQTDCKNHEISLATTETQSVDN